MRMLMFHDLSASSASAAALNIVSASSGLPALNVQAVATCRWMSTCAAQYASFFSRTWSRSSASFEIAAFAASMSQRFRKIRHGLSVEEGVRPHLERRRTLPVAALDRIAHRRSREPIRSGDEGLAEARNRLHVVDDCARLRVLAELQVRIDEVVHGVQLIVQFLVRFGDTRGRHVGLLPVTASHAQLRSP